jgi:hypothetical protein
VLINGGVALSGPKPAKTGSNYFVIDRVLGMGCYVAISGVLHDFGSYHESTWASGICGAHTCMPIPLEGIITTLYCSRNAIDGVGDVAYSI